MRWCRFTNRQMNSTVILTLSTLWPAKLSISRLIRRQTCPNPRPVSLKVKKNQLFFLCSEWRRSYEPFIWPSQRFMRTGTVLQEELRTNKYNYFQRMDSYFLVRRPIKVGRVRRPQTQTQASVKERGSTYVDECWWTNRQTPRDRCGVHLWATSVSRVPQNSVSRRNKGSVHLVLF